MRLGFYEFMKNYQVCPIKSACIYHTTGYALRMVHKDADVKAVGFHDKVRI